MHQVQNNTGQDWGGIQVQGVMTGGRAERPRAPTQSCYAQAAQGHTYRNYAWRE